MLRGTVSLRKKMVVSSVFYPTLPPNSPSPSVLKAGSINGAGDSEAKELRVSRPHTALQEHLHPALLGISCVGPMEPPYC